MWLKEQSSTSSNRHNSKSERDINVQHLSPGEVPKKGNKKQINQPIRTVFFYNIDYNASQDEFRTYAEQFGEIYNLFGTKLQTKGNAFVTYYNINSAIKAVDKTQDIDFRQRKISSNYSYHSPFPIPFIRAQPESNYSLDKQTCLAIMREYGEVRSIERSGNTGYDIDFCDFRVSEEVAKKSFIYIPNTEVKLQVKLVKESPPRSSQNSQQSTNVHPTNQVQTSSKETNHEQFRVLFDS